MCQMWINPRAPKREEVINTGEMEQYSCSSVYLHSQSPMEKKDCRNRLLFLCSAAAGDCQQAWRRELKEAVKSIKHQVLVFVTLFSNWKMHVAPAVSAMSSFCERSQAVGLLSFRRCHIPSNSQLDRAKLELYPIRSVYSPEGSW